MNNNEMQTNFFIKIQEVTPHNTKKRTGNIKQTI